MSSIPDFQSLLSKVNELKNSRKLDLSLEEDLSIAVMNLISLEEHFFFTSQKTGKDTYLDLLKQIREVRKKLLSKLIDSHEGETWCITKHLLATTMRIMEVATKLLGEGKKKEAKEMFSLSYQVYSLFWALRLKLIDLKGIKSPKFYPSDGKSWTMSDIVTKLVDCCKE
jgi:hypothetical protein